MKMYYYQEKTDIQRIYYNFYREFGRNAEMFPFIKNEQMRYFARYILPREFFRRLQPFQFLKEGDNVIHVGFHDQYIDLAVSHPLIISAVVGPHGHVWAFDPDERNTSALSHFIRVNNIENITVITKGVWKEKGKLVFHFFKDFTSSNIAVPIANQIKQGLEERWGGRIKEKSYVRMVEVDTLDSIVNNLIATSKIDFINLTVNGAEPEIIQGAEKTLNANSNVILAFPLANVKSLTYDYLSSLGYNIAVADAQHRPWEQEQFLYGCAVRHSHNKLTSIGFREIRLRMVSALSDDGVGKFSIEEV